MDKETKKKNIYNTEILNRIKEKYGLSKRFITMSLSGDRTSEMTDTVKKDYKKMENAIQALLKTM
jgi:Ni,Fe-hydrogenase maturation factor